MWFKTAIVLLRLAATGASSGPECKVQAAMQKPVERALAREDQISSGLESLSTFKLDDDLRVVILFSLIGLLITVVLAWLTGADLTSLAFPSE
jgi:hypothetical protein